MVRSRNRWRSRQTDAAGDIQGRRRNHIYLKEDGSLSYAGFEIVTHPATLDYHINHFHGQRSSEAAVPWVPLMIQTHADYIFTSRTLFGDTDIEQDLTIAKIILLIDRWYDDHIVRFSPEPCQMRRWATNQMPTYGLGTMMSGRA